jgi:hypothetical protein
MLNTRPICIVLYGYEAWTLTLLQESQDQNDEQKKLRKMGVISVPLYRWFVARFLLWRIAFNSRSVHMMFVVDIVALWQVISEYFSFSANYHSMESSLSLICHPELVEWAI